VTFAIIALLAGAPLANTSDVSFLKDTSVKVFFSPNGGCTDAIISEIDQARTEILVQAYSFTSAWLIDFTKPTNML
jgi:hypothetical protein